jgi:hypothetical protein
MDDKVEYECEHDPPNATFYYNHGGPTWGDSEAPAIICSCGYDDTVGDFAAEWVSADAWRGHVEVRPGKDARWVEVHDDGILVYSEDERMLKAFDEFLRESMESAGIGYVRAFGVSSNVFFRTYTLFVDRDHAERCSGSSTR